MVRGLLAADLSGLSRLLVELRLSEHVPDHVDIPEVSAWNAPQKSSGSLSALSVNSMRTDLADTTKPRYDGVH